MNANKIIHEARGLLLPLPTRDECVCNCHTSMTRVAHMSQCCQDVPDYTAPINYCELMDWMQSNNRSMQFYDWLPVGMDTLFEWLSFDRNDKVKLIADWLGGK